MKIKKELLIEITNKCPFNCIFCSSDSNLYKDIFINSYDFFKIISEAKDNGFEIIQLSGGEPFLHPNINDFIDFILKQKLVVEIYTCGNVYLNGNFKPIPKKLLSKYKDNKNLSLRFNFQTINEKTFITLTKNPLGLKNLIKTIEFCLKLNINSEVHIIPNNLNITQLDNTINFLMKKLKIKHIKLLRLIPHGRALVNLRKLVTNRELLYKILLKIKQDYNNFDVEIGTAFSELSNSCISCQAAKCKFMITVDLKIYPCTAFKNLKECFINITDQNSFKKIYKSNQIGKKLDNFNYNLNLNCDICTNKNICFEICPVQRYICYKSQQIDFIRPIIQSKVHH